MVRPSTRGSWLSCTLITSTPISRQMDLTTGCDPGHPGPQGRRSRNGRSSVSGPDHPGIRRTAGAVLIEVILNEARTAASGGYLL